MCNHPNEAVKVQLDDKGDYLYCEKCMHRLTKSEAKAFDKRLNEPTA